MESDANVITHTHHGIDYRYRLDEEGQLLRWERGRWEPLEPLEGGYVEDLAAREYRAAAKMMLRVAGAMTDDGDYRDAYAAGLSTDRGVEDLGRTIAGAITGEPARTNAELAAEREMRAELHAPKPR